jgi:alkanesulfonate monooxygenase SsuD/methylene tetrahydromethanopterin reductase-like flavin-dependent oxidoreductase (luciferase family)
VRELWTKEIQLTAIQPISAMAAVTKNLSFAITASTTFEPPFLLAKRFSTLDHLTDGRIGWNIVTSWKKAAFKAIGLDSPIEHDERYRQADEYLRVLYKYAPQLRQSLDHR